MVENQLTQSFPPQWCCNANRVKRRDWVEKLRDGIWYLVQQLIFSWRHFHRKYQMGNRKKQILKVRWHRISMISSAHWATTAGAKKFVWHKFETSRGQASVADIAREMMKREQHLEMRKDQAEKHKQDAHVKSNWKLSNAMENCSTLIFLGFGMKIFVA